MAASALGVVLASCVTVQVGASSGSSSGASVGAGVGYTLRGSGVESTKDAPVFLDWWYQSYMQGADLPVKVSGDPMRLVPPFRYRDAYTYVPMPQPGGAHGVGFTGYRSWQRVAETRRLEESGAPVVILLRERNSPFPYDDKGNKTDPDALRDALDRVRRLDYVVLDLEHDAAMIQKNVREIVRVIRTHPNPAVSGAWIGNYNEYPGATNKATVWPKQNDRTKRPVSGGGSWDRDRFYRRSGLNMAMPSIYPYEAYSQHADARRRLHAPNKRAAIFWAPVEHFSVAKRALPEGHTIVPWVSNYIAHKNPAQDHMYNAPAPSRADLEALITHIYLRGADGFAAFTSDSNATAHPDIGYRAYRELALDAWRAIDVTLGEDLANEREVLELSTDIASGVTVSAARFDGTTAVFVSNLSGRAQTVRIGHYDRSLPDRITVPGGAHVLEVGRRD